MVFSTNQARQLYVAVDENSISPVVTADGNLYFEYIDATGADVRSDLIPIKSITSATATPAEALATKLPSKVVTLKGDVIGGAQYILTINYKKFVGMSEEDTYSESADVTVPAGTSASTFYKKLAIALAKNTAKQGLVVIKMSDGTEVTQFTTESFLDDTYTSISITAADPSADWVLGTKEATAADFTLSAPTITAGGAEVEPFNFADGTSGTVANGQKIADLEYFCMGERGDVYRNAGWPNVIKTKYLVNPAAAYDVIDIHYAYQGTCEDIQKSEKDITIVASNASSSALASAIVDAINDAVGEELIDGSNL